MPKFRKIDVRYFIDAVLNPTYFFNELKEIEVLVDDNGVPCFFVGNNSVIFKVKYQDKDFALKCYENDSNEFSESISVINSLVSDINRDYVNRSTILKNELTIVDYLDDTHTLPVEIYPWIEGCTANDYALQAVYFGEKCKIAILIDKLLELAIWLINQKFSHGDIKCENIIITNDGTLKLIDFNNVFFSDFCASPTFELGTEGYKHHKRDKNYYNNRIDDFPILIILTTLMVAEKSLNFYSLNYDGNFLLFDTEQLYYGNCETYKNAKELFADSIIESKIFSFLEIKSPAISEFSYWLNMLQQWRSRSKEEADDIFFDEQNSKFGLIDKHGNIVYPAIFENANSPTNNYFSLCINGKWGVVDSRCEVILPFEFEYISPQKEECIIVKDEDEYSFYDSHYSLLFPLKFEEANAYHSGYAVVKVNGKYGYIDKNGDFVIEPIYDFAYNIKNNIAVVRNGQHTENLHLKNKL